MTLSDSSRRIKKASVVLLLIPCLFLGMGHSAGADPAAGPVFIKTIQNNGTGERKMGGIFSAWVKM